jgi:flagella basal body P-ring formation protein FlgA
MVDCRLGEAAETLGISIPRAVQIEGEVCALSDIASLEGRRGLVERAGALLLSVQNGVITREQVIAALRVSGLEGVRVELKMPATVQVETLGETPDSQAAPPAQSREDVAQLIKSLAVWDGEVEARYEGPVPQGRLVSPASLVPGTSTAILKFKDEGGKERSLTVRLVWSQPALVLTRSVKRGEILKESDFVLRSIRVNRPGVYASRPSELLGRSLKKNLAQGEAVTLGSIADVPVIERGKSVTIIARNAGLTVKAKGEALENGALGETIKVRNTASKAVLRAVVVGGDTVEVKMP